MENATVENETENTNNLDGMADELAHSMETGDAIDGTGVDVNSIDDNDTNNAAVNENEASNISHLSDVSSTEEEKSDAAKPLETKLKKSNLDELVTTCSDSIETILQYEQERRETNAEINAVREKLESLGISKKALGMAIAVSKMSEDQLDGFDLAYRILRKAIKQPIQDDLFN